MYNDIDKERRGSLDEEEKEWLNALSHNEMHGLAQYLAARSLPWKLFWVGLIVCFVCLGTLHTWTIAKKALSQPTLTRKRYEPINQAFFPYLTICAAQGHMLRIPDNVRMEAVFNSLHFILPLFQTWYSNTGCLYKSAIYDNVSFWACLNETIGDYSLFFSTFKGPLEAVQFLFKYYSVSSHQLLQTCALPNGKSVNCSHLFRPIFSADYGLCYVQNNQSTLMAYGSGLLSKLKIEVNVSTVCQTFKKYYSIRVSSSKVILLYRNGKCLTTTDSILFESYTEHQCFWEHGFFEKAMKIAESKFDHCSLLLHPLLSKPFTYFSFDNSIQHLDYENSKPGFYCGLNFTTDILQQFFEFNNGTGIEPYFDSKILTEKCKPLCERWSYWIRNIQKVDDTLNSDLSIVEIFLDGDSFPIIEDKPAISWVDFAGLIGGNFGLWLGASIISFSHLFYLFAIWILHRIFNTRRVQ